MVSKKEDNVSNAPILKEVVRDNTKSGSLKMEFTVELSDYDTSKMPEYEEGDLVYKGHFLKLSTLKPNKANTFSYITFDPANLQVRNAILKAFESYDNLKNQD